VVPAVLAAGLALLPLAYLAVRAWEGGLAGAWELLSRPRTLELVGSTLRLVVAVTVTCVAVGLPTAWLIARTRLRGRATWAVLAALPLAVPSYVAAFVWVSGPLRVSGFTGAWLVLSLSCLPYVVLPSMAALRATDSATEEVSRSLGHGAWRTFLTVTLPQVWPATAAGALLVVLYVLQDFGAVSITRYDTLTRALYATYRGSFDRGATAVLALVLVALTLVAVAAEQRMRGRGRTHRLGGGTRRPPEPVRLGRWALPAYAWLTVLAALGVGVPVASLAGWLLRGRSGGLDAAELASALVTTVEVATLGALVTLALAFPVGVLLARYRGRLVALLERVVFAGHALPGVVVGLGLVFLAITWAYPVYQSTLLLVVAYAVLFLPKAVGSVRAAVAQSPPVLEEVARSLGRTHTAVLRQVTLPLSAPGVAVGGLLVLLTAMKELPATLLLRPTGSETLATELWARTAVGAYSAAAPYAVALVLLAAVPAFLLARATDRLEESG
jgi:iron(III) transport system permease protein